MGSKSVCHGLRQRHVPDLAVLHRSKDLLASDDHELAPNVDNATQEVHVFDGEAAADKASIASIASIASSGPRLGS